MATTQVNKSYSGQTSIRFRDLEAIDDWQDVRRVLGLDLPVRPIGGAVDRFTHPDPDEWQSGQQAALARGGSHAQAVANFFADRVLKEPTVVTETFNPTIPLGQFCAETELALPKAEKLLVVMFYSRLTKRGLLVAERSQFVDEWDRFLTATRA